MKNVAAVGALIIILILQARIAFGDKMDDRINKVFKAIENRRVSLNGEMYLAIKGGNIDEVRSIIKKKPEVVNEEAVNGNGSGLAISPLHMAVQEGKTEIVKILLENGADVNSESTGKWPGLTPLYSSSKLEITRLLVKNGAKIKPSGKNDWTPLHLVNDKESIQYLVQMGADVNAADRIGMTPLHMQSMWGRSDIAGLLISKGAGINARNIYGRTPLDITIRGLDPNYDVIKCLLSRGADISLITLEELYYKKDLKTFGLFLLYSPVFWIKIIFPLILLITLLVIVIFKRFKRKSEG